MPVLPPRMSLHHTHPTFVGHKFDYNSMDLETYVAKE